MYKLQIVKEMKGWKCVVILQQKLLLKILVKKSRNWGLDDKKRGFTLFYKNHMIFLSFMIPKNFILSAFDSRNK